MFFIVFTGILLAMHGYVGVRMLQDTRVPRPWNVLGWLSVILLALSIPATFVVSARLSTDQRFWLALIAYGWLGTLFYLWTFFMARDAWRILAALVRARSPAPPANPERRVFVSRVVAASAAAATIGIGAGGVRSALGEITKPEVPVRLQRLPKALDGFRIVQLSDVHIGPLLGSRFLRAVVDETNRMRPDLIVITGDLVDGSVAEIGSAVKLLGGLRARHGVYFVTGNHEYYSGYEQWVTFLERGGIPVLMNQCVPIGGPGRGAGFDLLGVPDQHAVGIRPNMQLAAAGRDPERELIVLAHQPVQIEQSLQVNAGLQLSGHTHGGQMQPFGQIVSLVQPYVAGLHREHDTQIYVSRGTGFWGPPMRVLAPAEITRVVLVSG
jgi:predicted MPP superfamily phosphohydrolase